MRLKYSNKRKFKNQFWHIQHNGMLWWIEAEKRWSYVSGTGYSFDYSNSVKCNSVKAFKRHLKKHPILLKEGAVLVNKYEGYDVFGGKNDSR